jgi:hypothetical protein
MTEAIKAFLHRLLDVYDPPPADLAARIQTEPLPHDMERTA